MSYISGFIILVEHEIRMVFINGVISKMQVIIIKIVSR